MTIRSRNICFRNLDTKNNTYLKISNLITKKCCLFSDEYGIKNDDLVLVEKHAEPKWELVKNAFHIFANSPDPYQENISFQIIKAKKIPDISKFLKRSTVVVFEDLCTESKRIQECIVPYFISERHQNISPIYVTQKYQAV